MMDGIRQWLLGILAAAMGLSLLYALLPKGAVRAAAKAAGGLILLHKGLRPKLAFTIMESVRKGKGLKDEWIPEMKANGVEDWYIDSCLKIKYLSLIHI